MPFSLAAVLMAAGKHLPRRVLDVLVIATTAAVAVFCALLLDRSLHGPVVYWFGGWQPRNGIALGISFVIDPFAAALALLASLLVLAGFVYSWRYFNEVGPLYPALMLTFLGAMAGFALTGDLFNLFVFFELMSVAAYALTATKIEEEESLMGAINFAVSNSIGSFLVLVGIALVYGRTGALNLAQISAAFQGRPADGLVLAAWVLIASGFSVKAALVPFHFWLADAHAVAPTPVCVLFSGVMVELGLYAVLRVYWSAFAATLPAPTSGLQQMLFAAGTLSAVLGGIMCFAQRHLKRLLAFSTVSHMGMFLIGAACFTADGLAGAAVYVLAHGCVKGGLFLCTGIVLNRFGSVDENRLRGRAGILGGAGVFFAAGGLALSGMPPFGTCSGKALIEDAAAQLDHHWVWAVFLLCSALTGGAVLRAAAARLPHGSSIGACRGRLRSCGPVPSSFPARFAPHRPRRQAISFGAARAAQRPRRRLCRVDRGRRRRPGWILCKASRPLATLLVGKFGQEQPRNDGSHESFVIAFVRLSSPDREHIRLAVVCSMVGGCLNDRG